MKSLALSTTFLSVALVFAATPDTLQKITAPTTIDLSKPPIIQDICWDVFFGGAFRTATTTLISLVAGSEDNSDAEVVDVIRHIFDNSLGTNCFAYFWPTSLVPRQYHVRINVTTNSTESDSVQQLSGVSNIITVGPQYNVTCGQSPGNFVDVSSPTSPAYTSLYISKPAPGLEIPLTDLEFSAILFGITETVETITMLVSPTLLFSC
ncbi:hypothetical protein C8J56DRAFT_1099855 [Mycena floridula]|nr:hypothetical protein C8J56DRAFT_1099855 [Mycena floridula]